jgi:hypothetical protein
MIFEPTVIASVVILIAAYVGIPLALRRLLKRDHDLDVPPSSIFRLLRTGRT